jgi:small-conductance mechanosensitive channel
MTNAVPLLHGLWADLHNLAVLWQFAVIALCVGAAWYLQRAYERHILAQTNVEDTVQVSIGSVQRMVFPVSALLLLVIGRGALDYWHPVGVLNVAVPLLFSYALIRISVYMLRHVFAPGRGRRVWERYVTWAVWTGVAIHIVGLWPQIRSLLDGYALAVGSQRISALVVLQAVFLVGLTLLIGLWLGRFIEMRLMGATSLDVNLRVMFAKLTQALLVLAALLIALPAVGVDLTVLSVFGGMLGVGIGFGLQKIASNYISGFIILMDRSVGIGDLITVDNFTGQLTKMTARYVVVRSLTGTEALIPNETIITSTVVNHSYTDRRVRVPLPVQVSYRTDLDQATAVMIEATRHHRRVLRDPAPRVLIKQFADSGIDLELGVWIEDPQEGTGNLVSDIYLDMWRAFRQHGIEIPYPQREVRMLGPEAIQPGSA